MMVRLAAYSMVGVVEGLTARRGAVGLAGRRFAALSHAQQQTVSAVLFPSVGGRPHRAAACLSPYQSTHALGCRDGNGGGGGSGGGGDGGSGSSGGDSTDATVDSSIGRRGQTFTRYATDSNELAWFLLTSSNLSKAAWYVGAGADRNPA